MAKELQVSIDLGCESVKVCYAYKGNKGELKYGLMKVDDHPYPASVSYCREEKRWLIGAGIAQLEEFAYDTIVRIKDLISMVIPTMSNHGELVDNSHYYDNEKHFRRFYFPRKVKGSTSMEKAIANDQTFTSSITPKELCKLFFERLFADCITPTVKKIISANSDITGVRLISIYPAKANARYKSELEELVSYGYWSAHIGVPLSYTALSSPKATAACAYHGKLVKEGVGTLIVNVGERDTSLSKVFIAQTNGKFSLNMDGRAGHNLPIDLGGEDFDEAICELLNTKINNREVIGVGRGFASEQGTYRQQYLLLQEVKTVKECLSVSDQEYKGVFAAGVPINIHRDVVIATSVTREEFCTAVLGGVDGVGAQMTEYLKSELKRSCNKNLKTVLFTGGGASTYGLCEYVQKALGNLAKGIKFMTAEIQQGKDRIDSTYAAAFGAAILEPAGICLQTIAAMTYGTWCSDLLKPNDEKKSRVFSVIVDAGTVIPDEGYENILLFSTTLSEIKDEIFSFPERMEGMPKMGVGEPGSVMRRAAEKRGLRVVSGGNGKGLVYFEKPNYAGKMEKYNNISKTKIWFYEGLRVDNDGHVELILKLNDEKNDKIELRGLKLVVRDMPDFDIVCDY